jgi:formylglycine-generating enzyme required for sulfatase activity
MNIFQIFYGLGLLGGLVSLFLPSRPAKPVYLLPTINDTIAIEDVEVTVGDWLSYSNYILDKKGNEVYASVLPDSSLVNPEIWNLFKCPCLSKPGSRNSSMKEKEWKSYVRQCLVRQFRIRKKKEPVFFSQFAFPITGISYEQALDFCKWKTELNPQENCVYRLPTPEEWKQFSLKGMLPEEQGKGFMDSLLRNKCNCALYNYKIVDCIDEEMKNSSNKLKKVASYFSNHTGLYDVFGNVSEMAMTKGISKGGNYTVFASQAHVDSIQYYTKAEKWLGFRCVKDF